MMFVNPESTMIAEVTLFSQGFRAAEKLARERLFHAFDFVMISFPSRLTMT